MHTVDTGYIIAMHIDFKTELMFYMHAYVINGKVMFYQFC